MDECIEKRTVVSNITVLSAQTFTFDATDSEVVCSGSAIGGPSRIGAYACTSLFADCSCCPMYLGNICGAEEPGYSNNARTLSGCLPKTETQPR
jgi:hypothetical protein